MHMSEERPRRVVQRQDRQLQLAMHVLYVLFRGVGRADHGHVWHDVVGLGGRDTARQQLDHIVP